MLKHLLLIMLILNWTEAVYAAQNKAFIWTDDENYWPAIYRGKNNQPTGIFNDIMTELFKRLKIPLKKAVYPWKRAQKMVKDGEADGMVTVYTKERQKFTVATVPLWKIGETLFFRRDNPRACKILQIKSFKEMRGFTVVDIQGAGWTRDQYASNGITNIIWVPNTQSAFNMIAKGRADIFIMFDLNAFKILSEKRARNDTLADGYQNIVAITPKFASLPFRLLIRKDSPFVKRIGDINRALNEMKADGTYARIRQKYADVIPSL